MMVDHLIAVRAQTHYSALELRNIKNEPYKNTIGKKSQYDRKSQFH